MPYFLQMTNSSIQLNFFMIKSFIIEVCIINNNKYFLTKIKKKHHFYFVRKYKSLRLRPRMKGMKWWRSFRLYLCLPDRHGSIFCYITTKISRREATLTDYCVRQSVRYDSQTAERSAYRTSRSICEYFFVCNYIILYNCLSTTFCFYFYSIQKPSKHNYCSIPEILKERPTDWPTNQQKDRRAYREVTLPKVYAYTISK